MKSNEDWKLLEDKSLILLATSSGNWKEQSEYIILQIDSQVPQNSHF